MEHLPKPTGQKKSLFPAIPYLCQDRYDKGPFLDYPQRIGLPTVEADRTMPTSPELSSTSRQLLTALPSAKLQSFLQNWLFFGLLNEVLGDLYRHDDFVTTFLDNEVEKTIITTANLLSRLEKWEAKITQDSDSLIAMYEHIARCLYLAYACLLIEYPALDNDLKFHLASVAEFLGYAASKACNVEWSDTPRLSLMPRDWCRTVSEHFRNSVLLERSNCCPSQTQMLIQVFRSPQALAFVAGCFHEDGFQSHHASCDRNKCQAGDSVTSGQVTRHVRDSCGCKFLRVDEDLLADCLKKGCLPLLRLKEDTSSDKMTIEVVASTESTSYVALSHVWADGLGNPTATALPRCQLSRLKSLMDNLDFKYLDTSFASEQPEDAPEMLLWCDTLCCPVVSRKAKNMALRQMYRTYNEASVVLVLDRSLISHHFSGTSVDEACVRIAVSRWMMRLWTLQEGALAARKNKLWFQFSKTALPVSTLYRYLSKVSDTDIQRRGIIGGVIMRFHTFTNLFDVQSSENQGAKMRNIMRGLFYRSVTVPSDEPLIIATLLALDLSPILAAKPAKRMNALWRIIGTSPSGVDRYILFHMGPKIHERGLRWAPRSFLSPDSLSTIPIPGEGENRGFLAADRNAKGLVVELAGLRISVAKPAKGLPKHLAGFDSIPRNDTYRHGLWLKDCQGRWYFLTHRLLRPLDHAPAVEEPYAVISRLSTPWILYDGSSSPIPDNTKSHRGLLVKEEKEQKANKQQSPSNELTCVAIKSQVAFQHVPAEMNQICQAAYRLAQDLASSAAGRRLESARTDADYREALQDFYLEAQRLSRSPFAINALAKSGNGADERGINMLGEYMKRMYRGIYLRIEEYAPGDRRWCVD